MGICLALGLTVDVISGTLKTGLGAEVIGKDGIIRGKSLISCPYNFINILNPFLKHFIRVFFCDSIVAERE